MSAQLISMGRRKFGVRRANVSPRATYAPKVQVWGAISAQGKAYLEIFYGNMNSDLYMDILEDRFEPIALEIMGDSWILQHDGARCHTSRAVNELCEEMEIETLDCPHRSLGLSPIEKFGVSYNVKSIRGLQGHFLSWRTSSWKSETIWTIG